jgi:ABC-type cobalt transport system substrate-binding protein
VWMPPVSAHETMTFLVGPAIATAIVPYLLGCLRRRD